MFQKILRFFQLADRAGNLSITNIAVIVLITKIALAATLDWATAAGLLIALLNYGHKRLESNKAEKESVKVSEISSLNSEILSIKESVTALSEQVKAQQDLNATIQKQSEDTANILQKSNLAAVAASFKPMFGKKD